MRMWGHWLTRQAAAACLVLSLFVPFADAARPPEQDAPNPQAGGPSSVEAQAQNSPTDSKANAQPTQPATLPDSPGSMRSKTDNPPSSPQQPSAKGQQTQEPVGTAAAESVETTGVAASKPAGAAIAPAKQRRTRSMLIKVGAIVGASVAVGTVVALSAASPSRPPGAR